MNNQGKKMFAGIVLVAGVMLAGMVSNAAVLIQWQDGTAGHTFANWNSEELHGGAPEDTVAGDQPNGPLHLDPNTDGSLYQDVHFTTDSAMTGDLTKYGSTGDPASLRFNFYANADGAGAGAPSGLGFYFTGNGGHVWYYDIDTTYVSDGWGTYAVQLDYDANAYNGGGWYGYDDNSWASDSQTSSSTDFNTDLANVTGVGIWIAYNTNNSTQDHQVGLYGISVPEPGTYLLLGMALLSVAIVFRKRISESMAEARAMMRM